MTFHLRTTITPLAAVVLAILAVLAPGTVASAEDGAVAWSVSPAGADGAIDGRTRLQLQLDPGATATDHLLIANASSTDQTFNVYGADAFNTVKGGYDLLTADKVSKDAGTWVSVDQKQVTIPASKSAVVAVQVAVPAAATPGDHAAGVVVSRAKPAADAQGVVMDTRVAVRLSVRVAGVLTPNLTVQDVHVDYSSSPVPFGSSGADVRYTVKNTGNVTVLGEPRVRLAGPFGVVLATKQAGYTQEVLPGQSFTVSTVVSGIAPALVDTAVVDVKMAAAPGPDTTIPLVSATSSATFLAVPWTGLLVLGVLGLGVWWFIRFRRLRRQEGEAMWAELVERAKEGDLSAGRLLGGSAARDTGAVSAVGVMLVAAVLVGSALALALSTTPAAAADATPTGEATVQLSVPPAPTSSPTTTTTTTGTTTTTTLIGGTGTRRSPTGAAVPTPAEVPAAAPETAGAPTPTPSASATARGADTVWRAASGFTPAQWGLVSVSGGVLLGAGGLGVRALVLARAARVFG